MRHSRDDLGRENHPALLVSFPQGQLPLHGVHSIGNQDPSIPLLAVIYFH